MYRSFSLLRKVRLVFAPGSGKSLDNHPAGPEPAFLRPASALAETAARLAGLPGLGRSLGNRAVAEFLEYAVLHQTRHMVDILPIVAAKAGIDAHDDARLGPVGGDPSSSSWMSAAASGRRCAGGPARDACRRTSSRAGSIIRHSIHERIGPPDRREARSSWHRCPGRSAAALPRNSRPEDRPSCRSRRRSCAPSSR